MFAVFGFYLGSRRELATGTDATLMAIICSRWIAQSREPEEKAINLEVESTRHEHTTEGYY
jgi:hypothetical protein